jgi:RNA polymerase sigma factor (sigma-70 family)
VTQPLLHTVVQHVRALASGPPEDTADDPVLLRRFTQHGDAAAFAALVRRHGPMVREVCRRRLGQDADADDAFQATFLALVRRAHAIRQRHSLASWLYGVAYRVAEGAKREAARRHRRENRPAEPPADPAREAAWRELCAILDVELYRLAERYRAPLVLCYLQGQTRGEAARRLGWSLRTLDRRLERGRELLRLRLARRGLTLSAVLLAVGVSAATASAGVSAELAASTAQAAESFALALSASAAGVSARAAALAEGAGRLLGISRLQWVATLLLAAVAAGVGATLWWARPVDQRPQPATRAAGSAPTDRVGDLLPPGAVARFGTLRFRHQHTIRSLMFSGDGKTLVSGSWDETVRLWEIPGGRELRRFRGWPDTVASVAISHDGRLVAAGSIHLYHDRGPGRSAQEILVLWDAVTGQELGRITGLEHTPYSLAFARDGKTLAGVTGNVVRLWEVPTLRELRRRVVRQGELKELVCSPDARTAAGSRGDGSVCLWDLASGNERQRFAVGPAEVRCLAVSPDGKTLAVGRGPGGEVVSLWGVATGKELHRFHTGRGQVTSIVFSADSRLVAAGDFEGTVAVRDVATGKQYARWTTHASNWEWVMALAFAPDGKTLAVGGAGEKAVRLFDVATGRERRFDVGHQNAVVGVALAPDGRALVTGGKDGRVYVWDPASGRALRSWHVPFDMLALTLAPDGKSVATGGKDGVLRLWDLATGTELRHTAASSSAMHSIAFSADGRLVGGATEPNSLIRLWDVATLRERLCIKACAQAHGEAIPFALSPDGQTLATGSWHEPAQCPVYLWDATTGRSLDRFPGAPGNSRALAFSPDGRLLASTGWGGVIWASEIATGKPVRKFGAQASVLAFAPGGRLLASGGVDGSVRLWDLATGRECGQFRGHAPGGEGRSEFAAGVSALAFARDGRTLVSGGGDTTALLWDVSRLVAARPGGGRRLTSGQLADLWTALEAEDPARAYPAVWALEDDAPDAVPFLRARVRPIAEANPQQTARLIADLDSPQFATRERATRALERLGESAGPALRRALAGRPSAEVRRRTTGLLARAQGAPFRPEGLAALRALAVLEGAGTPDARDLLQALARGLPEARLTREARAALERLARAGS